MSDHVWHKGDSYWTPVEELPPLVRLSLRLRDFVDFVGRFGSWLILPLVLITVYDVLMRKSTPVYLWLVETFGRIILFESTLLQELEWHFHTGLFALVLGYGYIHNTHVRVDLIREKLHFRKKAWLEFLGCTFFMIPFTATVIWFAVDYAADAYQSNEISASLVGLSHRWIIKGVLAFGLIVALLAGIAVWLQTIMILWGPQQMRYPLMTLEWPEFEGSTIEGKRRMVLDENGNVLVAPGDPEEIPVGMVGGAAPRPEGLEPSGEGEEAPPGKPAQPPPA